MKTSEAVKLLPDQVNYVYERYDDFCEDKSKFRNQDEEAELYLENGRELITIYYKDFEDGSVKDIRFQYCVAIGKEWHRRSLSECGIDLKLIEHELEVLVMERRNELFDEWLEDHKYDLSEEEEQNILDERADAAWDMEKLKGW